MYFLFLVHEHGGVLFLVGSYLGIIRVKQPIHFGKFRLKIELFERDIVKNFRIKCYV